MRRSDDGLWRKFGGETMSVAACAGLVERGDPDRFMAVMSAPVPARDVLFPLYAFNLEIARAPWVTEEPMIAEMRLQWWRDIVEEITQGKPARAHEVVSPLSKVITDAGLSGAVLDAMVAARRWDIYKDSFEDAAHFDEYIDATAGGLMWLASAAVGAKPDLEQPCRDVGYAAGVAAWLQAVPTLESRGRFPLVDGRVAAVQQVAQSALDRLNAVKHVEFGDAIAALRTAWTARQILQQAVAEPMRVANGALGVSEFRKRTRLMWKTAIGGY